MKCQILFYGKNKKNLINLSSAESAHNVVSNNTQMSVRKKKVLQKYTFPEQWIYLFHPFQSLSFDEATKFMLLEIYANKKQIKRAFDDIEA